MNPQLLELHFAELSKAWNRSIHNNYSDNKKNKYQESLSKLYAALKSEDFSALSPDRVIERTFIIDFFFQSIDFLDNSVFNLIPFEAVECLTTALNDWINDSDEFIIVTSMVNNRDGYSFDPSLVRDSSLYSLIQAIYGIEFPIKLIQINIPKYLIHDYLVGVVLYHELGHFIAQYYNFTQLLQVKVLNDYYNNLLTSEDKADVEYYFPYLAEDRFRKQYSIYGTIQIFESHLEEYFSDIFAAQYTGKTLTNYLVYVTGNSDMFSEDHPSTVCRTKLIDSFFIEPQTYLVRKFAESTIARNKELRIRYSEINKDDLIKLIPPKIENEGQLHYLLIAAWDIWLNDSHQFSIINNMTFDLDSEKIYEIINNLVEKSIGNYVVEKSWSKAI